MNMQSITLDELFGKQEAEYIIGIPKYDNLLKNGKGKVKSISPDDFLSYVSEITNLEIEEIKKNLYDPKTAKEQEGKIPVLDKNNGEYYRLDVVIAAKEKNLEEIDVFITGSNIKYQDFI